MIALVQRVCEAEVSVGDETVGAIGAGILALIGVERGDGEHEAERLVERVLGYRIFPDAEGRMNLSLAESGGALLAVPQFTLAADTHKGARPSFSSSARRGRAPVRSLRRACRRSHRRGRERPLRRRHAGAARQRRAGDLLAAGFAAE